MAAEDLRSLRADSGGSGGPSRIWTPEVHQEAEPKGPGPGSECRRAGSAGQTEFRARVPAWQGAGQNLSPMSPRKAHLRRTCPRAAGAWDEDSEPGKAETDLPPQCLTPSPHHTQRFTDKHASEEEVTCGSPHRDTEDLSLRAPPTTPSTHRHQSAATTPPGHVKGQPEGAPSREKQAPRRPKRWARHKRTSNLTGDGWTNRKLPRSYL